MSEQNKAIVRRGMEEGWNKHNLNVFDETVTPDYIDHDPYAPGGEVSGIEAFKGTVEMYLRAFPDGRFVIEDQIAEGDKVVTRWTATGTHQGELMGIQPTGKKVMLTGVSIDRIEGGKAAETWSHYDMLGLLQQLGAIPAMAAT